jgi:hypothetical protein
LNKAFFRPVRTVGLYSGTPLILEMARRKSKRKTGLKLLMAAISNIQSQLHDIDHKLDYLIKNFRQFIGYHVHQNGTFNGRLD